MLTRRTFVDGFIGVAVLTPLAGRARAATGRQPASLLLWEDAALGEFDGDGLSVQRKLPAGLGDHGWKDQAERLLAAGAVSNVVVIGRPATVFVVGQSLALHWRVIGEGVHGRGAADAHLLKGPQPLLAGLSEAGLARPQDYVAVMSRSAMAEGPRTQRTYRAGAWGGRELSSLFALPRRSAV